MQIPIAEYKEMIDKGEVLSGKGYEYTDKSNKPFIEFHVDDNPLISNDIRLHPFGGNLSVQKLPP